MSRVSDFIVIGAMKCATSTLHEQLALQPGIFMSQPKEPNFFSDDVQFARGLDWYASLFAAAGPDDLCGESSTHYTKLPDHPHTVARLARHAPGCRFIYVMRHPVERLVSHSIHEWSEGRLALPIDEAVEACPALVEYGCYARQLRPYLETFGAAAVLPVFFERLRGHGQEQLERVCRFVGYGAAPRWRDDAGPANVSARRERPSRLRDGLRRVPAARWTVRAILPRAWRERIRDRLWRMAERPVLAPATLRRLEARFDEDLAELGRWLGIELSCRSFRTVVDRPDLAWVQEPRRRRVEMRGDPETVGTGSRPGQTP